MIGGLKPTPRSRKDFSLTATFGAPSRDLPRSYDVEQEKGDINGPRDQEDMFCTAYTISEIGADEHGIPMDAHFQAAMIGLLQKSLILDGADMREAVKSGRTFGFLPVEHCPFHGKQDIAREVVANSACWPELKRLMEIAKAYAMPAFFAVDGPYDAFDNVRAQLWQHKPDNGVALGIPWFDSFNDTPKSGIIPAPDFFVGYHAIDGKGFRTKEGKEVLRVRSWSGRRFGDSSYGYFDRETFNQIMKDPFAAAFMYKDVPDDLIQTLKQRKLDLIGIVADLISRLVLKFSHA